MKTFVTRVSACVLAALWMVLPTLAEEAESNHWLTEETLAGLEFRGIGPALMSGRIADIAIDPTDQSTWYVAVGSGGVWKTTNAGTTWEPIFDGQTSYSVGTVVIDPHNTSTVWVGSGENVNGRHVGYGDGVYRSFDGGKTWENLGLEDSQHIGRIVVHPEDPDTVFVASQGPLWSPGGDRGLFKSTDGGANWENILSAGEYTGVNDVVMRPGNPDVLLATTHQHHRTVAALVNGGPESGIHKSTDGGTTWRQVTEGLPEEDMGRIGLAISAQQPNVVYATVELAHRKGGFYRSEDFGETWSKMSDQIAGGTGPHYYQEVWASPHEFDRVYYSDVQLRASEDGGASFRSLNRPTKHVDNHAMAFSADDPDYLLVGCDGGLYESWDLGETWKFISNLPITQFYKVAVDYDEPFYNVVGGTQDNNTQYGPSATDNTSGIRNSDWSITLFGDGHQPAIDPTNPDVIYSEWQEGNLTRFDRVTGEVTYIKPQPEAGAPLERYNWDAPILISAHDPARIFFASQRVWRSDDRGDSWTAISGDLTRNQNRLELPIMGRVQSFDAVWDLYAMSMYNTITSLGESPLDENLLYAGTDDGLLQISEDGGANWRPVEAGSLPGLPATAFVNDIKADLHDVDTVYAAFDNHKYGDFAPYLYRSGDRGRTWRSIGGSLPERHLVWRLVQDHVDPELLFVGTEFGVFTSLDDGTEWVKLTGGSPTIPFRDLAIQRREDDLVGATFGRSFWILDDYSPLREVSPELVEQEAALFPVADADWYLQRNPLDFGNPKGSQGDAFFTAPNPQFGAVFTYYLKDGYKTAKAGRLESEKEADTSEDLPFPGWETLDQEDREIEPAVALTVRNQAGEVVRVLPGPAAAGLHRIAWDLRVPSPSPLPAEIPESEGTQDPHSGLLTAPGSYTVSLGVRLGEEIVDLGQEQGFEVVPLRTNSLSAASPAEVAAFQEQIQELYRRHESAKAATDEVIARLERIRETLKYRSATVEPGLLADTDDLWNRSRDLKIWLENDERRKLLNEFDRTSIQDRMQFLYYGVRYSTYGPNPSLEESAAIVEVELAQVESALAAIQTEGLPALEARLEAAGVPWTPGRVVGTD